MPIHTVLGPIAAEQLGPTSMHEHLLSDLRIWAKPPVEEPPSGVPMGPELRAYLAWNALSLPDNLVLHDPEVAAEELAWVRAAGGSAVVDLTLPGMGRRLEELPEISRRAGVHVLVGTGYYVEDAMPEDVRSLDEDALTQRLVDELTLGIATGHGDERILPALIGEVGSSFPITDQEWRSVRASGRAAVETGAAVSLHCSFRGATGIAMLEALLDLGVPADRIIVGHLDERFDEAYHRDIASTGALLGYDTFGSDFCYGSPALRNPTDAERLEMVAWLLGEGYGEQLVIAQDNWTHANLHRNGGNGYDHLFRRIGPAITAIAGDDGALVRRIMVETPRRVLDRP